MSGYIQMSREYQTGGALSDIDVYKGPNYHHFHRQGGRGIGKYIGKAFKYLKPFLFSGLEALTDQGISSAGSILNQLGEKDLKTVLKDEGKNALTNLKQKAINKINRSSGFKTQSGTGLPLGLAALESGGYSFKKPKKKRATKKRSIKTGRVIKKRQTKKGSRVGGVSSKRKKKQVGGKKKKGNKKKNSQTGGKRKSTKRKRTAKIKPRQLDIFD